MFEHDVVEGLWPRGGDMACMSSPKPTSGAEGLFQTCFPGACHEQREGLRLLRLNWVCVVSISLVSRLRRAFLYSCFLFVTVNLLPGRIILHDEDLRLLARSRRTCAAITGFALTAACSLPDHWHPIIYPPHPLSPWVAARRAKDWR